MRLETTTKIVLNRRKLEKYIDGLQTNETIYFTNKGINTIDKEAFKNLKQLQNLYLFDNNLLRIKPNTFVELSNLTFLHLKGNKLSKLEACAFRGLVNLNGLWLEQNEIEEIDSSAFRSLVKLKFLYLHENRLNDIDRNCFALFKRIGLITLYSNRFENDVVSYFKPELLPKNWLVDECKDDFVKFGGYKSDWNEFLEQFRVKLSSDCEKKSSQDTSNLSDNKENKITNESKEQQNQTEEQQKPKQNSDLKEEKPKEKVIGAESSIYSSDSINTEEQSVTKEKVEEKESIKQQKRKKEEANEETKQHIKKVIDAEFPISSSDSINPEKQNNVKEEKKEQQKTSKKDEVMKENIYLKEEKPNENVIRVESSIRSNEEQRSVKEEKKKKDSFERYEFIKFLGSGAFGTVNLVLDLNINQKKAMKIIEIENDCEVCELTHLWNTNHTNVLRYFDHFEHEKDGLDYVCVITEYCEGGDLRKRIKKVKKAGGKFEENFIFDCIRQATNGLKYLHSKLVKIVHRDIKPGNILLTKDGVDDVVVKLADLGVAKSLTYERGETLVGTKEYMSPEQYNSKKTHYSYSFNTDVWSLGCVLYELLFLKMAFPKGPIESPIPSFRDSGSERLEIVLSKMLIVEPENRIDSSKLYSKLNALFQVYKEESF